MDTVSTDAALEIVASIDPAWGRKLQIVQRVARRPGGLLVPYREMGDLLAGVNLFTLDDKQRRNRQRYAQRLLRELVKDRVLLVVEEAAGRRATKFALNSKLGEWRGVPWLQPVQLVFVRAFMDLEEGIAPQVGASGALKNRATRPVVARSKIAALRDRERLVPRSQVAALQELCGAIQRRATEEAVPEKQLMPSGDDNSMPALSESGIGSQVVDDPRVLGLANAIKRYNGWPYIAGKTLRSVAVLVELYGADGVTEAVPNVEVTKNPTRFMEELAMELAPMPDIGSPAPAEPPAPAQACHVPYVAEGLYEGPPPADARGGLAAARSALRVVPPCDNEPATEGVMT